MFGIVSTSSHASNINCLITGRFTGHTSTVGPQHAVCFMSHFSRLKLVVTTRFLGDLLTPTVTGSYTMKRPQTFKKKVSSTEKSRSRISVQPGVRFPAEERDYSLLQNVQTGSGPRTASYSMGIRGYFPGGRAARV
jgi:hypothetical protein